ncbi:hypothetical protein ANN_08415 [Periplaneta americana]|uniref:Uncharacterized protein n=1 Tax=Periplaneta americana TaxID=6978 RepID=A0ABQ8T1D3_PERAM|nr:hypothetical protein ANN_08415 [Periplaneta americana]
MINIESRKTRKSLRQGRDVYNIVVRVFGFAGAMRDMDRSCELFNEHLEAVKSVVEIFSAEIASCFHESMSAFQDSKVGILNLWVVVAFGMGRSIAYHLRIPQVSPVWCDQTSAMTTSRMLASLAIRQLLLSDIVSGTVVQQREEQTTERPTQRDAPVEEETDTASETEATKTVTTEDEQNIMDTTEYTANDAADRAQDMEQLAVIADDVEITNISSGIKTPLHLGNPHSISKKTK